jgi:S1-C subfamily serine protease
MANTDNSTISLAAFSGEIEAIVTQASESVVRVEDGSRLTATGVIWSADGIVVTTSHGVERDEDLAIELADGTLLPAALVGRDPDTDIAVLRAQHPGLTPIGRLASDTARIGTLVLALARPGRSGLQASLGIVSARTETQSSGRDEYLLHTDADMYPGFSGGPLVDMKGNILGMTNLMFGRGRGIALGTPILTHVTQALLANGRVQRGYLGVRTQQVTLPEGVRDRLPWPLDRGLLIAQVEPGSPADSAGLLLGDTLLRLAETPIRDVEALRGQLRANPPGSEVVVDYLRGGDVGQVMVTLGVE